jgi:hypothetical protein
VWAVESVGNGEDSKKRDETETDQRKKEIRRGGNAEDKRKVLLRVYQLTAIFRGLILAKPCNARVAKLQATPVASGMRS